MIVDKIATEDARLSWKARGILSYMLSKPDNFVFYLDKMAEDAPDGIDSLRAGIKELQEFGYVIRYPVKEKGKIVSWVMDVYEKPHGTFPYVEKPQVENPMLKNKDLKENNLKENYKIYIDLPIDVVFLNIYNNYFKSKFNKNHMQVSEESLDKIRIMVDTIESYGIELSEWEEKVQEHFDNIPKSNNGNILAFLQASFRHFEVRNYNSPY